MGYPEKVDVSEAWPASPEYYNSALVVDGSGDIVGNYRKSFLYYTDETWALEEAFSAFQRTIPGLGNVALGICTDLKSACPASVRCLLEALTCPVPTNSKPPGTPLSLASTSWTRRPTW